MVNVCKEPENDLTSQAGNWCRGHYSTAGLASCGTLQSELNAWLRDRVDRARCVTAPLLLTGDFRNRLLDERVNEVLTFLSSLAWEQHLPPTMKKACTATTSLHSRPLAVHYPRRTSLPDGCETDGVGWIMLITHALRKKQAQSVDAVDASHDTPSRIVV
jgi:hypothetical protein